MDKANIKMDEDLAEQLEREEEKEYKRRKLIQDRNESEGVDPKERASEKAEDAPAPTDVDDEDITLGEFFDKREGVSEEFGDFGEELRRGGKMMREAATESTASPGSTQKTARIDSSEASGVGPLPPPRRAVCRRTLLPVVI